MTRPTSDFTAAIRFPLRVAAIDVGSNAIRMLTAEFADPTQGVEIEARRAPVRLGHDAFRTGHLTPEAMAAGTDALVFFRRRLDELRVDGYRAVATSAVRESRNGGEFIDRVQQASGLRLEAIGPGEEARLVWVAARRRIPLGDRPWILADLGGGSVEVSAADSAGILATESHGLGSVRLIEEIAADGLSGERLLRLLEERVADLDVPDLPCPPAGMIATGGSIEVLASIADCPPERHGVSVLPLSELRALAVRMAELSYEERITSLGLREDRADVIVPAAVVYEHLARRARTDRIHVPYVGVRQGLLLDQVRARVEHRGSPPDA